jgi:cyanophycinase
VSEDYGKGLLIIIGGAEDKKGECIILRKVVELASVNNGKLVILTTATAKPGEVGAEYGEIFRRLGIDELEILDIPHREVGQQPTAVSLVEQAGAIFFTGGDQLRITSLLGGTALDQALHRAYQRGAVVAGTSAGASAMSATMIVEGAGQETPKQNTVKMAPGMGLLNGVVIDQHFAQRGRLGRLLTAVAQNPRILGIGLDEDTAIVVHSDGNFAVIGSQTVSVIDGMEINHTNVSEIQPNQGLALTNVKLHILPAGYGYSLQERRPLVNSALQPKA